MPNAAQFARQLTAAGVRMQLAVSATSVETAKGIRRAVAERTPVLTGRAQASWNLNVGQADNRVKGPAYNNPTGSVDAGNVSVGGFRLGNRLIVSNNIDYIGELNAGSSRKAPAGFVELTVANLQPIVNRAVVTVRTII